ncbi:prion-inhibition and propagation-domain-containing protein [Microdochium trichocladiopsis]|uniref:Prion-inhibition and propagation-domain-containing protein n=1 Tax=Microdochium trichocladiopsis TaxID=1682393 RepID=A0A9P8Y0Q1_9PEZI|nr:prion-inhibition and propagation-domain-containing protein [Microdochium trichocladiopsis]KAH7024697.1 prion-inhibition and propagation-domain-containing protein [Microdochium trichocladiopsis]
MAATVGIVTSALSVAALFNNTVDTFGYIQLGRNFEPDFTQCKTTLAIAQWRLDRWAQSVHLYEDPRFMVDSPADEQAKLIHAVLMSIDALFLDTRKASKRCEQALTTRGDELVPCTVDTHVDKTGRKTHDWLSKVTASRGGRGANLMDKTFWAIYDAKNFDKLIVDLTGLIDGLEKLSSTHFIPVRRHIVSREIEEMESDEENEDDTTASLRLLQGAASNVDAVLQEVVTAKIETLSDGHNRIGELTATNEARVQNGDQWTDRGLASAGKASGLRTSTKNEVKKANLAGRSRLLVGTSYGGSGFWDEKPAKGSCNSSRCTCGNC